MNNLPGTCQALMELLSSSRTTHLGVLLLYREGYILHSLRRITPFLAFVTVEELSQNVCSRS
jgi:hypothetical protein